MKVLWLVVVIFLVRCVRAENGFVLDPKVDKVCKIVVADDAIPAEETAAKLLLRYLPKMVEGIAFNVVKEREATVDKKCIFVGWTRAATDAGLDTSRFDVEEELVAVRGERLFVSGGRTRGARYAAADLLERLGVTVTADDTEDVPKLERIFWDEEDLRRKPCFACRSVACPAIEQTRFNEFNKYNGYRDGDVARGGYASYGRYGDCHTFVRYSQEFPLDNPNVFALVRGKRQVPNNTGQKAPLCPTCPRTLELMLTALEKDVAQQFAAEKKFGLPRTRYYEVSMDDELTSCECADCRKAVREDGCYAGAMLRLINPMARRLSDLDPKAKITMLVYQKTLDYPKLTMPEPNVQPRICVHDCEWQFNVLAEAGAPLSHPYNGEFVANMARWMANTASYGIWEYWEYYTKGSFPAIFPKTYRDNLRHYADTHAENILIEIERERDAFFQYKHWLALKLMDDPFADLEALTARFFRVHYGAAAKSMRTYFDFLSESCEKEMAVARMSIRSVSSYRYLNVDFFREAYRILAEAELLAKDDVRALRHLRGEYVALDRALLRPIFQVLLPKLGFTTRQLVARLQANETEFIKGLYSPLSQAGKSAIRQTENFLLGEGIDAPLPSEVKGDEVFDFKFNSLYADENSTFVVEDPDAIGFHAVEIRMPRSCSDTFHKLPFILGCYNSKMPEAQKIGPVIKIDNVPQDEKYHLYHIGKAVIASGSKVWAHWTWYFQFVPRDAFAMTPDYLSDVWVSLKLTGPAYVKGSKTRDGIFIDRIIIAR